MATKIKICGVTRSEDALTIARVKADMMGFVFFRQSPRYCPPEDVREMVTAVRAEIANAPLFVGVFVNEPTTEIIRTVRQCGLDVAQLHANETNEDAQALRAAGIKVIKAFGIESAESVKHLADYDVDAYLCDTPDPVSWGGTGRQFDHTLLVEATRQRKIILAGGLRPDNVAGAIHLARPWGVDVSSGVEQSPGIKAPEKINAFVEAVRSS